METMKYPHPPKMLLRGGIYELIRELGHGGFGITYEARHISLGHRVAIKELTVRDDRMRQKFIEEARAIASLRHPNIVGVHDVFEENGTAYYVMDFLEGCSLDDIVEQRDILPEDEALRYIQQVADALECVHGHGLLHLDIKPANIMIDGSGHATLIDFGVSKKIHFTGGALSSTILGYTPGYAPIEQMSHNTDALRPATDIYSLGATLYRLVTGQPPADITLRVAQKSSLYFPSTLSPNVRAALDKSLQISVEDRPQSVVEFMRLLDDGKKDSAEKQQVKGKTSKKWLWLFLILPVVAFVIGALTWQRNPSEEKEEKEWPSYEELCLKLWDGSHSRSEWTMFKELYADTVLYYGKPCTRAYCVESKRKSLVEGYSTFEQHSTIESINWISDDTVSIQIKKHVLFDGKEREYPSYLTLIKTASGNFLIIEESDLITDAALKSCCK